MLNPAESQSSPFVHSDNDVARMMWQVIIALSPGIAVTVVLFGFGLVIQILLAVTTAAVGESLVSRLRGRELRFGVEDGTAVVLALIVAISLPPYVTWWITVTASAVASLLGKHAFGGTGNNIFNPAMVGYLFVLVCFPKLSSYWPASAAGNFWGPIESAQLIFGFASSLPDAVTGATVLEHHRVQIGLMRMRSEFTAGEPYGSVAGRGWEWVNLFYLLGGVWMWRRKVIGLKIPLSVLGAFFICALVMYVVDAERYADPLFHGFAGGLMIGAWFVATDPVSAATTPKGMVVYGIIIGVLIYFIRAAGPYPDGVAFAVILANALVPLIDRVCTPRRYGVER